MSEKTGVPAPFIYFEGATYFMLVNGVGKVSLEVEHITVPPPGEEPVLDRVVVAHLVGHIEAIKSLRAALDGVLLLAQPKSEGPAN